MGKAPLPHNKRICYPPYPDHYLNNERVCEQHFVSKCPTPSCDRFNVDWIPTVNLGHDKAALREGKKAEDLARAERGRVRQKK